MEKKKYIITADDYGLCAEVNLAIEQLADRGILSSTNVMTNFQKDFSAASIKKHDNFSIGLHWNVTTGKPVNEREKIKSLVSENGCFYSIDEFRRRFRYGLINKDELKLELQSHYDIFFNNFC